MKMKPFLSVIPIYVFAVLLICTIVPACNKNDSNNNSNPTGSTVSIKNFAFDVSTLTVANGTTVTWTNNDNTAHTVTADDNSFNSGSIAPGATYSRAFSAAGTFAYHCTIHPSMHGSVVVSN